MRFETMMPTQNDKAAMSTIKITRLHFVFKFSILDSDSVKQLEQDCTETDNDCSHSDTNKRQESGHCRPFIVVLRHKIKTD